MRSAVKIKLKVSPHNAAILDSQSKIANWQYNHLLETANRLRKEYIATHDKAVAKTLYGKYGLRNLLPMLKEQHPFLKALYSSVSKNTALRLTAAIGEYRKSRRGQRKKPVAWPKFRSWKQKWFSLQYDEPWKGYALESRKLKLSLGKDAQNKQWHLELELAEPLPNFFAIDQVCQLRIAKESEQFYAIFTIERCLPSAYAPKRVIALDPNHKDFAYGVDNSNFAIDIANPYFLKNLDRQIDAIKSRRDRCRSKSQKITRADDSSFWRPSRRWRFFNQRLQCLYSQRREQTKTFLYTIANRLFRDYDVVSIGNYTPHGGGLSRKMRRAMNNQSLIGRFKLVVSWLASRSGKHCLIWEEAGSTRTCYPCGHVISGGLDPSIRFWTCPACHTDHIRDENAAQHGLQRTLPKLQLPCSGRRVSARRAWRFNGLGVLVTPGITDEEVTARCHAADCQEIKPKRDTLTPGL